MKSLLLTCLAFMLLLSACGGTQQPGNQTSGSGLINWDRSPQTIVFRADTVGGENAKLFRSRNEIPLCTIYGDNRIVWTNELNNFNTQVLWDKLTDQQIQDFVSYLTLVQLIYNHDAQASLQPQGDVAPVAEVLEVFVNGREHQTDSFSDWPLDYFKTTLDTCKAISTTPVLFEPEGAWVSAQVAEFDPNVPGLLWDGQTIGLRLSELAAAGERRWITGQNLLALWNIMRTSSALTQFNEDAIAYDVALEVPGVHRSAPAAP